MSGDELKEQLARLFWGAIAPFNVTIVPAGTKSMSVPVALSRAMAVAYRNEIDDVRAVLRRVEAGLPNQRDYPNGQIDLSTYNRRILSIIEDVAMEMDRVEAGVAEVMSEIDESERRY